jgi:hypothetical protein
MSQKERIDAIRPELGEMPTGLAKLTELARQAYERKNTKDCLDLTRAMLLIDPDNVDAQSMRTAIQSDLHRDLENARAFLRQPQPAESIVQPERATAEVVPVHTEPVASAPDGNHILPAFLTESVPPSQTSSGFPVRWFVGAAVIVVLGAAAATLPWLRTKGTVEALPLTLNAADKPNPIVKVGADQPNVSSTPDSAEQPAVSYRSTLTPVAPVVPAPVPAAPLDPLGRAAAKAADSPVVPAANGILAISSPTSVDIYKDDVYMGSVPVSLELAEGTYTLEYRHGSLRRTVTHVVKGNETTRSTITFDVSLPINSRPWADVYIEGPQRKALGQTPLGRVSVPIGSVLIFENPKFQPKKYRVTGNESTIQVQFP